MSFYLAKKRVVVKCPKCTRYAGVICWSICSSIGCAVGNESSRLGILSNHSTCQGIVLQCDTWWQIEVGVESARLESTGISELPNKGGAGVEHLKASGDAIAHGIYQSVSVRMSHTGIEV